MRHRTHRLLPLLALTAVPLLPLQSGCNRTVEKPKSTRLQDVVYGRKHGMALTMDVFTPRAKSNGVGVIWVVSGGWFSAHELIGEALPLSPADELLRRGYTVFAVVHSSQPQYSIPEILQDMQRSVRYIRYHAAEFHIDPDRIGITGGSSGGHLALMQGMAGDGGDPLAMDPVDRTSSRVQAVSCFFPPTDFLNYGKPGVSALGTGLLNGFKAPFAFKKVEKLPGWKGKLVLITDAQKIREIGRQISPINFVSAGDPPTSIIHGEKDELVPLQQSQSFVARLHKAGVRNRLIVKSGAGHGWNGIEQDMPEMVDWFDTCLLKK